MANSNALLLRTAILAGAAGAVFLGLWISGTFHRSTQPSGRQYAVKPGDTLEKIAQRFYGEGQYWTLIAHANPHAGSPDKLPVGLTLIIPPAGPAAPPPPLRAYTVRKGDTLEKISERFYGERTQWRRIAQANPGLDPKALKPGMTILIPATRFASRPGTLPAPG